VTSVITIKINMCSIDTVCRCLCSLLQLLVAVYLYLRNELLVVLTAVDEFVWQSECRSENFEIKAMCKKCGSCNIILKGMPRTASRCT
jgi:hypothetical protein